MLFSLSRAGAVLKPRAICSAQLFWARTSSAHRLSGINSRSLSTLRGCTKSRVPSSLLSQVRRYASEKATIQDIGTTSKNVPLKTPPSTAKPPPILAPKSVGIWLMISSTLVIGIIVVGGVTRLTESGLSITEWQPITGVIPPLTQAAWEEEFTKYKATPEFKLLNSAIQLEDFKRIFYMEWGHRVLGRLLGVVFVVPLAYFAVRKKISPSLGAKLGGLALLIGAQGLLGWYMVKSGLDDALMDTPGAVPRVSQYRLAAHLGLALVLYAGMFSTGLATIKEWKYAKGAPWVGMKPLEFYELISTKPFKRFRVLAFGLTGLVFLTALSGAFVAGLDAGLLYNEFPLMGGRLHPPKDELFSPAYAKSADKSDLWWRNIFENPTTVQFDHRVLGISTYVGTGLLYLSMFGKKLSQSVPAASRRAMGMAFGMANIQAALGISTLLYLVPVPLAAAHQTGSVLLLTAMIHVLLTLRGPGAAARAWRKLYKASSSTPLKSRKPTV